LAKYRLEAEAHDTTTCSSGAWKDVLAVIRLEFDHIWNELEARVSGIREEIAISICRAARVANNRLQTG
jgi:hypothetical protein